MSDFPSAFLTRFGLAAGLAVWIALGPPMTGTAGADATPCGSADPARTITLCTAVIDDAEALKREIYQALAARASALHDTGQLADAVKDYSRMIRMYPTTNPALVSLYTVRGYTLYDVQRYGEAIADFDRVLADDAGRHVVRRTRAYALRAEDRLDEALADWTHLIEHAPDGGDYRRNRAEVYLALGLTAEAFADAQAFLQSNPDDPLAHSAMGTVYAVIGDQEAAFRHLLEGAARAKADGVTALQMYLAEQRHYDGPIDGVVSPFVEQALRSCLASSPCRNAGY